MDAAVTYAWLAIGCACAALVATAPLRWAAAIMVFAVPMSGTAVFMLGGDPILFPLVVAVGFIARHAVTLLRPAQLNQFLNLARSDLTLMGFAVYCIISGLFFPRLFAGQTHVFPQVWVPGGVTLGPELISVVQIAYLALGVWTYLALRQAFFRAGLESIVIALMIQAGLFGGFGLLQALAGLAGAQLPTSWIVSNSGYSLLTQVVEGGFVRVTSVFIEASYFSYWAVGALAFCYALYINRILPAYNLALSGLLALTLLLSTSSTAYFGLVLFAAFAILHAIIDNDQRRRARGLVILLLGGLGAAAALAVLFSSTDGMLGSLRRVIEDMTINKGHSESALSRAQLSNASLQNAVDTSLLGVGYGAERSSGLIYQLIGSVGVPGLILFVLAMGPPALHAFKRVRTGEDAVASAGGFALVCVLGTMCASGSDLALPNILWVYAAIAAAPVLQRSFAREARERAAEENETDAAQPIESGA